MVTNADALFRPLGHDRVREHTAPIVNERIDRETEGRLAYLARQDDATLHRRLAELDHEWDIDRVLMANFAVAGGLSLAAGIGRRRGWLYLFGAQMAFLLLHALNGWCPPASLFRRLGVRTHGEIEAERHALRELLARRSRRAEA